MHTKVRLIKHPESDEVRVSTFIYYDDDPEQILAMFFTATSERPLWVQRQTSHA
jgi:hypothetical protein